MQLKHNTLSAKYFLTSAIGIITLVFLIQGVVFLSVGLFLPVFVGVPEVLPKIFAFIGLADLVFGGVLFWYRRRQLLRHQQLMESGMVVYGELLEVKRTDQFGSIAVIPGSCVTAIRCKAQPTKARSTCGIGQRIVSPVARYNWRSINSMRRSAR